jgi:hypothetical protein
MRKEDPDSDVDEAEEIRELIRAKIDIYGLTMEDIEYFKNVSNKILSERDLRP